MITIWHNPRCSKSRMTLALLQDNGHDPVVRNYLEDTPDVADLHAVLDALGMTPIQMIRTGEAAFKDMGLRPDSDDAALIQAMAAAPILIERPIVLHNGKARIGRPPESVLAIL